jgi:hypothetical protein
VRAKGAAGIAKRRSSIAGAGDAPSRDGKSPSVPSFILGLGLPHQEGWLLKKASKIMVNPWQKRYFELKDTDLSYYSDSDKSMILASIDIENLTDISLNLKTETLSFNIKGTDRGLYQLRAGTSLHHTTVITTITAFVSYIGLFESFFFVCWIML